MSAEALNQHAAEDRDESIEASLARIEEARERMVAVRNSTPDALIRLAARMDYAAVIREELTGKTVVLTGSYETKRRHYKRVEEKEVVIGAAVLADSDDPELSVSMASDSEKRGFIYLSHAVLKSVGAEVIAPENAVVDRATTVVSM